MSDIKDTIYDADPHTKAKHAILREYMKRWMPILSSQAKNVGSGQRLLYVDGFAGAGEYSNNAPGSPLVAIDAAAQHCRDFNVPIVFVFVEKRKDRCDHLKRLIETKKHTILGSKQLIVEPLEGDCETEVLRIIKKHKDQRLKLGPAFFFLDQFGYSSVSVDLVRQILSEEMCEVFTYLNWNLLHPFMTDETKWPGISKAFGGDEWQSVLGLSGQAKEEKFKDAYVTALQNRGCAKYVFPFAMKDQFDRVIYWLFFCTNKTRGLEEMKKAMWTVDRSGGFEFSDKHATQTGQMGKLFSVDDAWLANHLFDNHKDKTMTVGDVFEYVLTRTPCYAFKDALAMLEREERLEPVNPPAGRRRGSFTDESMCVRFVNKAKPKPKTLFD